MSIENALAEQTAAIRENTRALAALCEAWNTLRDQASELASNKKADKLTAAQVPMAEAPAVKAEPQAVAPAVEAPTAPKAQPTPAATPTASETAPTATAASTAATASPSEGVTLKQLTEAVTAAATRNRDGLLAALAQRGVKRATELAEDQWPALLADLEAV